MERLLITYRSIKPQNGFFGRSFSCNDMDHSCISYKSLLCLSPRLSDLGSEHTTLWNPFNDLKRR